VAQEVIFSANVQHLEFKGQTMVVSVFEVLASEPKAFLPQAVYALYQDGGEDLRVICDYVAAMTDGFLLKTYDRLFSPRMGSVFDRL
jgi:dGTPase